MTVVDDALAYAHRGWRVVPIKPGEKRPALNAWQDAATTDPELIADWWSHWPDHGIGIATGSASHLFVLDVDVSDGKPGEDTLADLVATHGPLPDTVETITGTGGRHLYFAWPDGQVISNDAGVRLGPGLDIRGEGGQVLAPPTIHPNGTPYHWEASSDPETTPIADAPQWLIDLLTKAPDQAAKRATVGDGDPGRPGARWAQTVTWPELLEPDGAMFVGTRVDHRHGGTYELWARPGINGDHASATLYYGGTDVLKVHTSSWPGLIQGETYTRFGYYAATRHNGDHARAAAQLRAEGHGDELDLRDLIANQQVNDNVAEQPEDVRHGWETTDLAVILAEGYEAPSPVVLRRDDGVALFYAGRVNGLIGESGSGKSFVAIAACAQVLDDGGHVLYVDLEDHAATLTRRLLDLGVDRASIIDGFHYVQPELAYGTAASEHLEGLVADLDVALVVIDSVGEAMALQSLKQNDDDEVARWFRALPRRLAALGPAVVLVDHVPKAKDAPSGYAIGSQRKRAAIDGHSMRCEQIKSLGRGLAGVVKLTTAKDRNGVHPTGMVVAEMHLDATGYPTTVAMRRGSSAVTADGSFRPTVYMERVSRALEVNPGLSGRQLEEAVTGYAKHIRAALRVLIEEHYVEATPKGSGFAHTSIRAFRDDQDDPRDLIAKEDHGDF